MDWVTWINTGIGVIGIVVGIIGWKSLNAANKIVNKANADNGATIQQAQIIHNGLDDYAVIRLSRETTQEELQKIIREIQPVSKEGMKEFIEEKVKPTEEKLGLLEETVENLPKSHVIYTDIEGASINIKDGDIILQVQ